MISPADAKKMLDKNKEDTIKGILFEINMRLVKKLETCNGKETAFEVVLTDFETTFSDEIVACIKVIGWNIKINGQLLTFNL